MSPELTSAEQLRELSRPDPYIGGRSRAELRESLGRAAHTVESLHAQVTASQGELAKLQLAHAELEQRLEVAARRRPESILGEVMITAHLAAKGVIENAQREAALTAVEARRRTMPLLADARRVLEEAARLHREAQGTLEQGRRQAEAMLAQARAERDRLADAAIAEVERRRSELDAENSRLERAIKGLRTEWTIRANEALARLDGIAIDAGSPKNSTDSAATAETTLEQVDSEKPHLGEVVDELRSRLATGTGAPEQTSRERSF